MTDAEIDALEAGRELDRLVALECGFTLVYDNGYDGEFKAELWPEEPRVFRPSSDWNDAMWAVVNFFGSTQVNVAHVGRNGGDTPWHVWVDEVPCIETQAASGPLAICRAILKAGKNAST